MKAHRACDGKAQLILKHGNNWKSALRLKPRPLYSCRNSHPLYPLTGHWVGPRADLDVSEETKISCTSAKSNPGSSRPYPSHYTD